MRGRLVDDQPQPRSVCPRGCSGVPACLPPSAIRPRPRPLRRRRFVRLALCTPATARHTSSSLGGRLVGRFALIVLVLVLVTYLKMGGRK